MATKKTGTAQTKDRSVVPLKDIAITWRRPAYFVGEEGRLPVTITGDQLATVLEWLAMTQHPSKPQFDLEGFGDHEFIGLQLEGLSEILQAVADSSDAGVDMHAICWTLASVVKDLGNRMNAAAHAANRTEKDVLATATVALSAAGKAVA